jgi:hypothetical protein
VTITAWLRAHRGGVLGTIAAATALLVLLMPPMPQAPAYHAFADARSAWGMANAWNVLSNLPFAAIGLYGLMRARRARAQRAAWSVTFLGISAVSAGSAWYHWAPGDAALAWDRWPMAVGFMGLLTALVARTMGATLEQRLLLPAVVVGIASVAYWRLTGDLRPYIWVQFTPLVILLLIAAALETIATARRALGLAVGLYALAKLLEMGDAILFDATNGTIGGHALKHLAAAAACLCLTRLIDADPHTPPLIAS